MLGDFAAWVGAHSLEPSASSGFRGAVFGLTRGLTLLEFASIGTFEQGLSRRVPGQQCPGFRPDDPGHPWGPPGIGQASQESTSGEQGL